MYQCRFIKCNKGTTLVGGVAKEEGYAYTGGGDVWEISVTSPQLCCVFYTALKNELNEKIIG